jgi:acetyl-CoA carboxylase biotin carboxyl carrier protein
LTEPLASGPNRAARRGGFETSGVGALTVGTELTHEDVKRILALVDEAEHLQEVEIVYGDLRLHVRRDGGGSASAPPASMDAEEEASAAAAPPLPAPAEEPLSDGEVAVRAPLLGTFYRSPAPGEPPFVEVGQRVRAEDTVCLIEVMKLFKSIEAGVEGVVKRIPAENGQMVEYNQVLMVIAPDAGS